MTLPVEWVRRLKETAGVSHKVIGVEWSPASPEIRLRALAVEELERESVREEAGEPVSNGIVEGGSDLGIHTSQVVADRQPS